MTESESLPEFCKGSYPAPDSSGCNRPRGAVAEASEATCQHPSNPDPESDLFWGQFLQINFCLSCLHLSLPIFHAMLSGLPKLLTKSTQSM